MEGLIVGIVLFLAAFIAATVLQMHYKYRYSKNSVLFVTVFLFCIGGASWFLNFVPSITLITSLVFMASLYVVCIQLLVLFWKPMRNLYGAETIPNAYQDIIDATFAGQVVKVCEIALQDMAAWLIVGGLLATTHSLVYSMILFTSIVFILHVPGLWMFGQVYGSYFLILVSTVAFLVPLFYRIDRIGFIYLYALHLSGYIALYFFMGFLGKRS